MVKVSDDDRNFLLKVGLYGAGVAIVGYGSYVFVQGLVNPGAKGGSCDTPGTPCYEALAGCTAEGQTYATQYATQLQAFITADGGAGNALTSSQLAVLADIQTAWTNSAAACAKIAYGFAPTSGEDVLANLIGTGAEIGIAAIGLAGAASLFAKFATSNASVAGVVSKMQGAIIEALASAGQISRSAAAAISDSIPSILSTNTAAEQTELTAYVNLGLISEAIADGIAEDDAAAMAADAEAVESALEDIGAGAAAAPKAPGSTMIVPQPYPKSGCSTCGAVVAALGPPPWDAPKRIAY